MVLVTPAKTLNHEKFSAKSVNDEETSNNSSK